MRDTRGLTLVELVVSAALLGLVAAAGASVVASAVRLAAASKRWSEAEHHARAALQRVGVLLRAAGYGAGERLLLADRSRVEFLADLSEGIAGPERHGFYLGPDGVLRELWGNTVAPLTTEDDGFRVASFELAYFDRDGRELAPVPLDSAQRAAVARVRVRATIQFWGHTPGWKYLALEDHVTIRLAGE